MTVVVLVALGAAVGAPARYLIDQFIQTRHDSLFPWGTFAVNIAGSLLLGLFTGLPVSEPVMAAVGVGFCGALTTYSTFGYETVRLAQNRAWCYAAVNVTASILAGLGAAYGGLVFAQALTT